MSPLEVLGDEIATLATQLEAGEYRLLVKVGEFDARGGYAQEGALTCAHWLSYKIGLGLGPAREKVRVARLLPRFPLIARAFEAARLSFSKVRAISRVATPENEALLVEMAENAPASILETLCRRFRGVLDADAPETPETPAEADERRRVRVLHTDDGRLRLSVELDADEGARLLAALDVARQHVSAETPTRADALMLLVESFLANGPKTSTVGVPTEVRLHVTEEELRRGGGFVENAGGAGVSAETAQRLACDAAVVKVGVDAAGKVVSSGRRARVVSPSLRRALELRDHRRCAFPGCTRDHGLDAHHVEHWANGGATELSNLVLLCRRHHTFVHEHHYRIERAADGSIRFVAPDRTTLPRRGPAEAASFAALVDALDGARLGPLTPLGWDGSRTDHAWVIDALCAETCGRRVA